MAGNPLFDDPDLAPAPDPAPVPVVAASPTPHASGNPLLADPDLAPAPDPAPAPVKTTDYANTSWPDVLKQGASALPGDFIEQAMAIPRAVANPGAAWEGAKSIARGAGSQLGVYQDDAATRAQDEAAAGAAVAPYSAMWQAIRHGDTASLKQQLMEHPAGFALAMAPVAGGGAGVLGKAAGAAEAAGAAAPVTASLSGASKALGAVGTGLNMADPVFDTTQALSKIGGPAAKVGMSWASGKPVSEFTDAFQRGKEGGLPLETFNDFATGRQGAPELSAMASKAVKAAKNDEIARWAASKQGAVEANKGPVPLINTGRALREQWDKMGDPALAFSPDAHNKFLAAWDTIAAHNQLPANHPAASIPGIDLMKQRIYDLAESERSNPELRNALLSVHQAVGQDLRAHAPVYGDLMDRYQGLQDNFNTLAKTLGTGDKTSATAEMRNFLKAQKSPNGRNLIDQLAQQNPMLPHAVAGAAFKSGAGDAWGLNLRNILEATGVAHGFVTGNPWTAAGAGAAAIFGHSPWLQRTLPTAAGVASRAAPAIGNAYTGARNAAQAVQRAAPPQKEESPSVHELVVHPSRPAHARGGRVAHQHLVDRLFRHVERAKREEKAHTSSLLEQPDSAVAKALNVAQASI